MQHMGFQQLCLIGIKQTLQTTFIFQNKITKSENPTEGILFLNNFVGLYIQITCQTLICNETIAGT